MCDNCFEKEISKFNSYKEFDSFDLELTKKVSTDKLTIIEDSPNERGVFPNYTIYKCQSCLTTWYLSEPDHAWRGFFLKKETAKIRLKYIWINDKKRNIGCWSIIALLLIFITYLIVKQITVHNNG